jgi:hypothetical protein
MKANYLLVYIAIVFTSCNQLSRQPVDRKPYTTQKDLEAIACTPATAKGGTEIKTAGQHSQSKTTSLPDALHIIVDGFRITPLVGLGSWAAFTPCPDSAMVTGDIIINETDLASVLQKLDAAGLSIKDVHRYGARNGSIIVFMHVIAVGSSAMLSASVNTLFTNLKHLSAKNPEHRQVISDTPNLNKARLDSIIGIKGKSAGRVYKYAVARPVMLRARGIPVNEFLVFDSWAAWQGTNEEAIVTGGLTMLENELAPVLKVLAENGFELVYNHLVYEEPDVFFLHYWGVGNAETLAKGLRAAFNQQETE